MRHTNAPGGPISRLARRAFTAVGPLRRASLRLGSSAPRSASSPSLPSSQLAGGTGGAGGDGAPPQRLLTAEAASSSSAATVDWMPASAAGEGGPAAPKCAALGVETSEQREP